VEHNAKVGAVFATYNRKECALQCLDDLLRQSRALDRIVITLNGCSDGTGPAILERAASDSDRVSVIELPANLGNPSGSWLAIERAMELGSNWIWLLDDDARVAPDALEKLLSIQDLNPKNVYGSLAVDPSTGEMSWPLGIIESDGRMRIASTLSELPSDRSFQVKGIWLGALIPREIFKEVGPLEADMFIRGEDEEYSARIRERKHRFYCIKDSLIKHVAQRTVRIPVFGKNYFYQPALPPWKAYYLVRNHAYIRMKHAPNRLNGIAQGLATVILSVGCALFLDNEKASRLRLYLKAGWDAFSGKLGRRVSPPY
jgi:rhamnopyranosyl-N-acetylglucosaminyl-diphospho-decaprenol beta-1,3/1,4-galactofuranosyltransferase